MTSSRSKSEDEILDEKILKMVTGVPVLKKYLLKLRIQQDINTSFSVN